MTGFASYTSQRIINFFGSERFKALREVRCSSAPDGLDSFGDHEPYGDQIFRHVVTCLQEANFA